MSTEELVALYKQSLGDIVVILRESETPEEFYAKADVLEERGSAIAKELEKRNLTEQQKAEIEL